MRFVAFAGWLGDLGGFLGTPGLIHLGLGVSVLLLAGAWLWSRRSLVSVRAGSENLAERLEAHELRLAELETARWAADPDARARRNDELVRMLGSLLSYTEAVRNGGAPAPPDPEGVEPWT